MNDDSKIKELSKIRLKKSVVGLFFAVLSFLSYQIFYLSIFFAILAILFSIISLFEKQWFGIFVIIISIASIIIYFLYYKPKYTDPNIKENIFIGTWTYNTSGGTYVFSEDYTYYQYITNDITDNYCLGTYRYTYGIENAYGITTYQDYDYYYYVMRLNPSECIISGKTQEDTTKFNKDMIFGFNKFDSNTKSIIINASSENIFYLTKIK